MPGGQWDAAITHGAAAASSHSPPTNASNICAVRERTFRERPSMPYIIGLNVTDVLIWIKPYQGMSVSSEAVRDFP
jgi:hypothetical protein